MSDAPIYGLDIETDTTTDGLDPRVAAVVAVAVAGEGVEVVLEADEAHEAELLRTGGDVGTDQGRGGKKVSIHAPARGATPRY